MNLEMSIVPVSQDDDVAKFTAEIIKIVEESGVEFIKTPMSIILSGGKDAAMEIAKKCHGKITSMTDRAITKIRMDETNT